MPSKLDGQVVFITGASSGIGAACARAFASEGARLLLAARRLERLAALEPTLREAGAQDVRFLALDVRDAAAVRKAIDELPAAWKAIEVLVNNAGLSRGLDKLHEGSIDDWDEMLDTNVKGVLHVDRAVVPLLVARGRGIVIHLGSIAGRAGAQAEARGTRSASAAAALVRGGSTEEGHASGPCVPG